jgi:NifU-like protein involved in Fe-S cluster formation
MSTIREKFFHPNHFGTIQDADYIGEAGNKLCGDTIKFFIKEKDGVVTNAKFQNLGCMYSFACAEQTAEDCIGKTLQEAQDLTSDDIANHLGGLVDSKEHCAIMAINALRNALENKGVEDTNYKPPTISDYQLKIIISKVLDEFVAAEAKSIGESFSLVSIDAIGKTVTVKVSGRRIAKLVSDLLKRYEFKLIVR